jgi:serine protease Do
LPLAGLSLISLTASASELRNTPIVKAYQQARPSVVNIRGEKTVVGDASLGQLEVGHRVNGMGTGVVVDPRGYIVTNYHVVDGVRQIQVTTADSRQFTARLVNRDPETDLAIIKIDAAEPMTVIDIGSSSDLMPGEPVVAIGNAYGYEHTITRGIVSALHRDVQVSEAQFYEDLIQTDASINPGNSGGPLMNIDGQMIGINVAVRAGAQGIGFAIPVDKAMEVAARLLANSAAAVAWHGAETTTNFTDGTAELVVTGVAAGSPAAEAGVEQGDVIQAVDGTPVARTLDFQRELLDRKPGDQAKLSILRDKKLLTADVALGKPPVVARGPSTRAWDVLGLELKPIPADSFRRQHTTRYRGGLDVVAVRPGSPADDQGIRRGDVLVGMHIWETVSLENVNYIMNRSDFASLDPVKFFILRGSETLYGYLPVTLR